MQGLEPWSAESPSLYELEVNVIDQSGNIIEAVVQKVGFRRFRIENGIMTLNGKRIVFKGADRHEFDAKRGRSITEQDMIDDVIFASATTSTPSAPRTIRTRSVGTICAMSTAST